MTDPIADMLTRIRNSSAVSADTVSMPFSRMKSAILTVLKNEGYIQDFTLEDTSPVKTLTVTLKYDGQNPVISSLKRISKPGRRVYMRSDHLDSPLSGHGISILTTNQGVMTNKEARKRHLGGEIICQIW